jgi:cysteine desulfurase
MIYLDHAATTPLHPLALEAMLPYFNEFYGNPSSIHVLGRRANVALSQARRSIARLIHAQADEVIFTSGGSEGANTALRGIARARRAQCGANRIVTSAIEHHAVLHTVADLCQHDGFEATIVPASVEGIVALSAVEAALERPEEVALVSVMAANNEIGTLQPLAEIGALCRAQGIPLHSDAVQAAGKLELDVTTLPVAAFSVSAHKFYGPKGSGFLYLRRQTPFLPILTGGSHENNRRAGTENVPGIVGMAKALELAEAERMQEQVRLTALREQLIDGILANIAGAYLTGHRQKRLSNIASFVITGVEAEGLLIALDLAGVAASSGSACTSAAMQPSHVLEAIGVPGNQTAGGLRFSLGRSTTAQEVAYVLESLPAVVKRLRG